MRSLLTATVVVCASVLAVGGCGDSGSKGSQGRPIVLFAKSDPGGKTYSLLIDGQGGATIRQYPDEEKDFNVGGGTRDKLRAALGKLRIRTLRPRYEARGPNAGFLSYSVTQGSTTVQVAQGARPPQRLARVIELLDDVVDEHT